MKILDIQHIDSDFNEFADAKKNIEDPKNIQSLTEFIRSLNVYTYVIMWDNDIVVPFNYFITPKEKYLFICGTNKDNINDDVSDYISNILIESKFDILSKLNEFNTSELVFTDKIMPDFPFIIYNNKYWIIK